MDHAYIEEHQIADRYVSGTLPEEEAERFENHYLSCPECLDRLDLTESVQRGFRRMATQEAERSSTARPPAPPSRLSRPGRRTQVGFLLAALLVLAILPTGLTLRGLAGRERELAQVRLTLEQERRHSATGSRSAAEVATLRAELAGARAERAQAVEQLAQTQRPQANLPILSLDVVRGAGSSANEPSVSVHRPPVPGRIVLSLQVDQSFQPPFRAILRDARGRELQRIENLLPDGHDNLNLSLPASLLPPGDYSVSLESLPPGRTPAAAGRFTFRVLPPA
jgi:anti-sigma factor RsiW